jgi:hypothetical protein
VGGREYQCTSSVLHQCTVGQRWTKPPKTHFLFQLFNDYILKLHCCTTSKHVLFLLWDNFWAFYWCFSIKTYKKKVRKLAEKMKITVFQKLDLLIIFLKKYIYLSINLMNKYKKLTFMIVFIEFYFFLHIFF